jgi:hypothetical protein
MTLDDFEPLGTLSDFHIGRDPTRFSSRNTEPSDIFSATAVPARSVPRFPARSSSPSLTNPHFPPPKKVLIEKHVDFLNELREARAFSDRMESHLASFDASRNYKVRAFARDCEIRFYGPVQLRLGAKLASEQYEEFTANKQAAIQNADKDPIAIGSSQEPAPIPVVQVSTRGLIDPAHVHFYQKAEEERLGQMIAMGSGPPHREASRPVRQTLDYKLFRQQRETRFFDGGRNYPKGRKFFEPIETFHSMNALMDDFQ